MGGADTSIAGVLLQTTSLHKSPRGGLQSEPNDTKPHNPVTKPLNISSNFDLDHSMCQTQALYLQNQTHPPLPLTTADSGEGLSAARDRLPFLPTHRLQARRSQGTRRARHPSAGGDTISRTSGFKPGQGTRRARHPFAGGDTISRVPFRLPPPSPTPAL
jgi:hypothetical protein